MVWEVRRFVTISKSAILAITLWDLTVLRRLTFNGPGCRIKGRGTLPLHLPLIIGNNRKNFAEIDYFCKNVINLKLLKVSNLERSLFLSFFKRAMCI